jgi:hypothetical protein
MISTALSTETPTELVVVPRSMPKTVRVRQPMPPKTDETAAVCTSSTCVTLSPARLGIPAVAGVGCGGGGGGGGGGCCSAPAGL